ncbi:glycosyltransferase family 2 protein [Microbacterium arborescens]|uniref:glycosyltransferase family 2 protein n=1 Tax=Microbacterium arborescens TaxID=33883 RepID=UPI000DF85CF3|nr:hypothetical protein [Microbacterium arborescens]
MTEKPLLLVVSTLGRVSALDLLLQSLADQLQPHDRLTIIAQSHVADVERLVARWRPRFAAGLHVATSDRGASRGRNAGVRLGSDGLRDAHVMFPNDTTTFPPGSVAAIRRAMTGATAGAVRVETPSGARFALPPFGTPVDARNVWSVIEMGLVIDLDVFRTAGGFDESIGTGAATPWQAGEVTDLLLRVLNQHPALRSTFVWVHDAGAHVNGIAEVSGLTRAESMRKLRAYGRGVGYVYRRHPFPGWQRYAFVVAGLLIGVRRGSEYTLSAGLTAFIGRLEGVRGRIIGADPTLKAVSR